MALASAAVASAADAADASAKSENDTNAPNIAAFLIASSHVSLGGLMDVPLRALDNKNHIVTFCGENVDLAAGRLLDLGSRKFDHLCPLFSFRDHNSGKLLRRRDERSGAK